MTLRQLVRRALTAVAAATAVVAAATAPATAAATAPRHRGGPAFVAVNDYIPSMVMDIRYATPHNFTGHPVDGYREPLCVLSLPAAKALRKAEHTALSEGYTLKAYDCYRPQRAVEDFWNWSLDYSDTKMKAEFYPDLDKSTLFDLGYIAHSSGHSRGSTLDLSLVKLPYVPTRPYVPGEPLHSCYAPKDVRFPDASIDMGTGFDCFDTRANTADPRITGRAHANRMLLKRIMTKAGFTNLDLEWWHYTLDNEPYPNTYFNFPIDRADIPRTL